MAKGKILGFIRKAGRIIPIRSRKSQAFKKQVDKAKPMMKDIKSGKLSVKSKAAQKKRKQLIRNKDRLNRFFKKKGVK